MHVEENDNKFYWKMDFWNLKTLGMKNVELVLFKELESGKLFEEKGLENYFQKSKDEKVKESHVAQRLHAKGGHARFSRQWGKIGR